jgi:hypothetical protein
VDISIFLDDIKLNIRSAVIIETEKGYMCDTHLVPVDIIAQYKKRFEWKSKQTTMERRIANEGVVLYDATRTSGHLINSSWQTEHGDV